MKKFIPVFLVIFVVFISAMIVGFAKAEQKEDIYKNLDLFGEALAIIQTKYVEEKSSQDLIHGALEGLLMSLDSYSQFLDPEGYKELLVETEGKFGGLGIEITMRDGLLTIVSPLEDSPAWYAGIKAGDIIVKIDGKVTKGITLHQAVAKLRGKPGTEVVLTVLRDDEDRKIEEVKITRDIIKIKDIKRAVILENGVGYIRLSEFRESTAKDLGKALKSLDKQGMKALILDLRNNPGGLLNSATDVSSYFLKNNDLIVYTKSKDGREVRFEASFTPEKYLDAPMVILINKGSASGSEIVAAALRENNRAILLGEKSFGKGSVQTVVPLSDGSAMRLTTAKYYTPLGTSIHDKGIIPDIVVEKKEVKPDKEEDIFEEIKEGDKEFNYKQDYQIVRALDLIRGLMIMSYLPKAAAGEKK
ncbi:MAG: S41 family peptidase [Candidatus Omnitrophota bacterium]